MKQKSLQRIAIIGLPGSGKSTFATKLAKLLNIPVHHLDKHMFEGKKKRAKKEFLSIKEGLVKGPAWIIEGCSFSTLEMRFARAEKVIYFNFPRMLCIWRICKRLFTFNKHLAETGCLRGINRELLTYIWNFDRDKRQNIEELRKQYPKVEFLIFQNDNDAENFLASMSKSS